MAKISELAKAEALTETDELVINKTGGVSGNAVGAC